MHIEKTITKRNELSAWYIGMYIHGFEKLILPDINKRSSLAERWEQAEA